MSGIFKQAAPTEGQKQIIEAIPGLPTAQPKVIPPSIGRVLWYWPSKDFKESEGAQACVALCTYVHSDRMVNIAGFDCNGQPWSQTSVVLCQPEDPVPVAGDFVEWMPYQIGQAK